MPWPATVPGSPGAACSTAPCPCTPSWRSSWPTGWAWSRRWSSPPATRPTWGSSRPWSRRATPFFATRRPMPRWWTAPAWPTGCSEPSATTAPTACAGACSPGAPKPDAGGVLVAVDGIYSMEGDWAPLAEVRALCDQYEARLLVDEAHALGVVGPRVRAPRRPRGVRADLIMGTFSKSLASSRLTTQCPR